jgi:hypothetical protein
MSYDDFERDLKVTPVQLADAVKNAKGIESEVFGLKLMFERDVIYPAQVRDYIASIKNDLSRLEKLIDELDPRPTASARSSVPPSNSRF